MADPIAGLLERAGAHAPALASIRQGYLLHYRPAEMAEISDPDLRLLEGDHRYALGLEQLARLEDPEAVGILAELISACAQIHASDDDPAVAAERADRAWAASIERLSGSPKR